MSLRFFVYYSAIAGALSALLAWAIGMLLPTTGLLPFAFRGLLLGSWIGVGLSLTDSRWNALLRPTNLAYQRLGSAASLGGMGGFLGGIFQHCFATYLPLLFWTFSGGFTGLFIGCSLGLFDWVRYFAIGDETHGTRRKVLSCLVGGILGGLFGGAMAHLSHTLGEQLAFSKPTARLWFPGAVAAMAYGMTTGMLIALAQVWRREAWLVYEEGREVLLFKPLYTIGRGEECDLMLNENLALNKVHAHLSHRKSLFILSDAGTSIGTHVNDERLIGPRVLNDGDRIRLGEQVLLFRTGGGPR